MKILISLIFAVFIITSVFGVDLMRETDEKIAAKLKDMGIAPILIVFLIAMLPIVELRGAIPVGILLFGLKPLEVIAVSLAGNMVPIFFVLFLFGPVERLFRKIGFFDRFFDWLFERTRAKTKSILKYEELGLMLFVAIPVPVTGAWTGSLASYLFKMSYGASILFIFLGVVIAGIIVSTLTLFWQLGIAVLALCVVMFIYVAIAGIIKSLKQKKQI